MPTRRRGLSFFVVLTSLVFCFGGAEAYCDQRSDLEKQLRQDLLGHVVMIRNFYTNARLNFNSEGQIIGDGGNPDWTTAQFEVGKVKLKLDSLEMQGHRTRSVSGASELIITNAQAEEVRVTIQLSKQQLNDSDVRHLIAKVFLTAHDDLAELVPDDWKSKVRRARERQIVVANAHSVDAALGVTTPPKVVGQMVDPDYPLGATWEGIVLLSITVDVDGRAKDITVVNSGGENFDRNAIQAIKQWRFDPATRNGQRVPVRLNVEVHFRRS